MELFKSKEQLIEELIHLLYDSEKDAGFTEKDKQNSRDFYSRYTHAELRVFIRNMKRTSDK